MVSRGQDTPETSPTRTDGLTTESLDEAVVFELVCNARRRRALRRLLARGETDLQPLVDHVVRVESGSSRNSVYASLRQHHLPRLADEGIVAFDPETGAVAPRPPIYSPRRLLEYQGDPVDDETDRDRTGGPDAAERSDSSPTLSERIAWIHLYGAICGISWSIALVDVLNLVAHEFITAGEWAVVLLLILSVFVLVNLYEDRSEGSGLLSRV